MTQNSSYRDRGRDEKPLYRPASDSTGHLGVLGERCSYWTSSRTSVPRDSCVIILDRFLVQSYGLADVPCSATDRARIAGTPRQGRSLGHSSFVHRLVQKRPVVSCIFGLCPSVASQSIPAMC